MASRSCRTLQAPSTAALSRWVAVLNLQASESRGYWSRAHELVHRIAEPPQELLPFRRHLEERKSPVEALVDGVAADVAFYSPMFCPLIGACSSLPLTFDVVESIRGEYARSASLLSVANATARHWPLPAIVVVGSLRGRRHHPLVDQALRLETQGRNAAANQTALRIYGNMRPPPTSPSQRHSNPDGQSRMSRTWATGRRAAVLRCPPARSSLRQRHSATGSTASSRKPRSSDVTGGAANAGRLRHWQPLLATAVVSAPAATTSTHDNPPKHLPPHLPVRHASRKQPVERRRVVVVRQMAQLVHDHVLDAVDGCLHQLQVEREPPSR